MDSQLSCLAFPLLSSWCHSIYLVELSECIAYRGTFPALQLCVCGFLNKRVLPVVISLDRASRFRPPNSSCLALSLFTNVPVIRRRVRLNHRGMHCASKRGGRCCTL
ncbi:hypothetical protein BKA93DRAFT_572545 [Sparassis latifolia]